jgi:hypothetical protein
MKSLLIASAVVIVMIGGWLIFNNYSNNAVEDLIDCIQEEIIPEVEAENWEKSKKLMSKLKDDWHKYKEPALLFLNTDELCQIDYSIARAEKYIDAEDISNSSGELNSIAEEMRFIISKEHINVENVL